MGSYHETSVLGWLKFGDLVSLILFSIFFCFVVLLRSIPQNVWTVDLPRCKPNQVVVLLKILSFYIVTGKRTSLLCLFPAKVGILMRPWQRFNPKWWIIITYDNGNLSLSHQNVSPLSALVAPTNPLHFYFHHSIENTVVVWRLGEPFKYAASIIQLQ